MIIGLIITIIVVVWAAYKLVQLHKIHQDILDINYRLGLDENGDFVLQDKG